jgi:hypothetical protein
MTINYRPSMSPYSASLAATQYPLAHPSTRWGQQALGLLLLCTTLLLAACASQEHDHPSCRNNVVIGAHFINNPMGVSEAVPHLVQQVGVNCQP